MRVTIKAIRERLVREKYDDITDKRLRFYVVKAIERDLVEKAFESGAMVIDYPSTAQLRKI